MQIKPFFSFKLLIWLIVFASLCFSLRKVFIIHEIQCVTTPETCAEFNFLQKKSLFFTNLDEKLLGQTFKTNKGQALQVLSYQKKLPHTLILEVTQQAPSYRLELGEKIYLVNQENFVVDNDEQYQLFTIELAQQYQDLIDPPNIDQNLNQSLLALVQAIENLAVNEILIKAEESSLRVGSLKFVFEFEQESVFVLAKKLS